MDCRAAEELLSDAVEGNLAGVQRTELDRHLAGCPACRALREAVRDVRTLLVESPVVEPPDDLVSRVVEYSQQRRAALGAGRRAALRWSHGLRLAAAVILIASGAALLIPGNPVGRALDTRRVGTRVVNFGVRLAERKDRLIEDLRMLRILAGTALQGRVERVNESVDDYRRLLEQRRSERPTPGKSGLFSNGSPPRSVGLDVIEARSRT
jgi:hypothetical protein